MRAVPLPLTCPVRGTSFRPEAVAAVQEGMHALVERDPDNPYDERACKVSVDGELVGYLPRDLSQRMWQRPEDRWPAVVTAVLPGPHATGLRISIRRPGQDAPGATTPASPTAQGGQAAAVAGQRLVHALSGRVLGALHHVDGTDVVILTEAGHLARYPSHLTDLMA